MSLNSSKPVANKGVQTLNSQLVNLASLVEDLHTRVQAVIFKLDDFEIRSQNLEKAQTNTEDRAINLSIKQDDFEDRLKSFLRTLTDVEDRILALES
jgi:predicted  nucleic acid-binding Zn-ribbon protein